MLAAFTILSTGAILRAGGRVFLGWGEREDPILSPEPEEQGDKEAGQRPQRLLIVPAAILAALAIAVGAVPTLETHARQAADRFENRAGYAAHVAMLNEKSLATTASTWTARSEGIRRGGGGGVKRVQKV